jgi:hypothetical protein
MPRQATITLISPEGQARLDRALEAVELALKDQSDDTAIPRTFTEADPVEELAAEYERIKAEAESTGVRITLRGLTADEWDEFADEFPPRTEGPNHEQDQAFEFDTRKGRRDLIYRTLVDPRFDSRAAFDEWLRERQFSRGELTRLVFEALRLTNGATADPKPLPASVTQRGAAN